MRIGALQNIKVGDLEKIDDIYKIIVYAGDKEEYFTFSTPECAKEIDNVVDTVDNPFDVGSVVLGNENKKKLTGRQKELQRLKDRISKKSMGYLS